MLQLTAMRNDPHGRFGCLMSYIPCEEIQPQKPANATVIWLHGLGANGFDFIPVAEELILPDSSAVRFLFPHAPSIPVTVNNRYVMPAWYDILSFDFEGQSGKRQINTEQMDASVSAIQTLIDREVNRGIASDRIFLAGFSQGGAVAYEAALTYPQKLGGLIAMSTYISTHKDILPSSANQHSPIHIFHGIHDDVVPVSMAEAALSTLQAQGFNPQYSTYPMTHEVCETEIRDISHWLSKQLHN